MFYNVTKTIALKINNLNALERKPLNVMWSKLTTMYEVRSHQTNYFVLNLLQGTRGQFDHIPTPKPTHDSF